VRPGVREVGRERFAQDIRQPAAIGERQPLKLGTLLPRDVEADVEAFHAGLS
jgi:hypothetical protein